MAQQQTHYPIVVDIVRKLIRLDHSAGDDGQDYLLKISAFADGVIIEVNDRSQPAKWRNDGALQSR